MIALAFVLIGYMWFVAHVWGNHIDERLDAIERQLFDGKTIAEQEETK